MKRPLVVGLAIFLQTAPPTAQDGLRFNWPTDLTARVETEKTRERQTGTTTKSTTTRFSYRMRAVPDSRGLQINYEQFTLDGVPPREAAGAADLISAMVPSLIVDDRGQFVGVRDIAALKTAMTAIFEPLQKTHADMPAGLNDLLSKLLDEEVLTSLAGQEWQLLVGAWHGLPLTPERFEMQTAEPSPLWPDVKVPMKVTGGMVETGTCPRSGARIDCAVFEMRSAVDQAAMGSIMKRLFEGVKDMDAVKYERMDVVTAIRIRLETHTMVPHELTMTKTVEMTVTAPREGRMELKQIDRRTSRFVY
jgi:hypothetical protein